MTSKKEDQILNGNLIELKKGVYYDPVKDSYVFTSSGFNDLGPFSVGLQITRRCNAQCIHCIASQNQPELNTQDMLTLVEKLEKGGVRKICVTGGEPLVRKDLVQILKKIHELGMVVTLSTNGLALTEDKIKQIKPFVENIRFSLHGLEENNDFVFQKEGAFRKILHAIKLARSHDVPVGVIFSVMRRNFKDLPDLARVLERKGVNKLMIFTLMAGGRAKNIFDREFIHITEMKETLEELERIKIKENWNLETTTVSWRIEGQVIIVSCDGTMFGYDLSSADHERKIGNLMKEDVSSLWNKYPYQENYINYYRHH